MDVIIICKYEKDWIKTAKKVAKSDDLVFPITSQCDFFQTLTDR